MFTQKQEYNNTALIPTYMFMESGKYYIGIKDIVYSPDLSSILSFLGFNVNRKHDMYVLQVPQHYTDFEVFKQAEVKRFLRTKTHEDLELVEAKIGAFAPSLGALIDVIAEVTFIPELREYLDAVL